LFFNRDYEPYALRRDEAVTKLCESSGVVVSTFKDHVLFEPWEVLKKDGGPYTVFTPYKNALLKVLEEDTSAIRPKTGIKGTFSEIKSLPVPDLKKLGFLTSKISYPARKIPPEVLDSYAEKRDFPGISGTSKLSIHLRFGTVSIREIASLARKQNSDTFFSELIWRDFYQMILWHFPQVTNHAFKPAYDRIKWRNNTSEFEAWCQGNTGYPIVDAGMRELNTTGFMHNRVRMVTASFLVKHLLIDWRWGEAYFAEKLLDFELASNNGGWQWAAGSGCDATPYFRIFNPYTQAKKFDPHLTYIRKWIPELDTSQYPEPIVEHMFARERCLRVYKAAVQNF
jgi:deoxyribodipyrimidine photo-lyase